MRDRPILFTDAMVRAILVGQKTQTRRPVIPQPTLEDGCPYWHAAEGKRYIPGGPRSCFGGRSCSMTDLIGRYCPYGQPGDRLWVREAWRAYKSLDDCPPRAIGDYGVSYIADEVTKPDGFGRYRHARFMPRWASRLTLEVVAVRVERVCDITNGDAIAEGCLSDVGGFRYPVGAYAALWDTMYARSANRWDCNPWVWVVEFRKLESSGEGV